ncbi:MAG: DNA alkylation repair protein [Candidatus Pacebacteria bacterium]|jgi:3-methyladenine DNA glycosylase AlkD|nr:DNA alkylation repair protein [Candidatus Paceibacterota bacterium]
MLAANNVEKSLKKLGTKRKAESSAWFFKTGVGQYGYGDVFIGVTVPEQRKIAKEFFELPLAEITKLLESKYHECRLTALLILVGQFKKADERGREKLVKFYLKHTKHINNWDLVDLSASYILGEYLFDKDRAVLYKLVKSKNIWERRIAIIATHAFIRKGSCADTFNLAEILLADTHDLIHKAVGWMLREVGKRVSRPALVEFLEAHTHKMPRTTLRYAIEHFSEIDRKKFLAK